MQTNIADQTGPWFGCQHRGSKCSEGWGRNSRYGQMGKVREKYPNSWLLNLITRKMSLKWRSMWGCKGGENSLCLPKAQLAPWEGQKRKFFQCVSFSLFQATNSHTNEVVAVKKMSYSGKQTNEVKRNEDNCECRGCCNHHVNLNTEISCVFHLTVAGQCFNGGVLLSSIGSTGGKWVDADFDK